MADANAWRESRIIRARLTGENWRQLNTRRYQYRGPSPQGTDADRNSRNQAQDQGRQADGRRLLLNRSPGCDHVDGRIARRIRWVMNTIDAKAPAATDQRAKAEIPPMDSVVRVTED
jgi:hypothetical protein